MKSVLLIVIDALTSRVFEPALVQGRLPTLQALVERGHLRLDCRSIFPSITPAATSTIITGRYPCEHGIAGASWYDEATDEVAYYGDDFWTILQKGTGRFFQDFLIRLNGDRLLTPTLFQLVERAGLSAACLNYLVYKGDVTHRIHVPLALSLLPGVPFAEDVPGPSTLCLGDFVSENPAGVKLRSVGGMRHRFGLDDAGTAGFLKTLASSGHLPDLIVAYFADNDYRSHIVGPVQAVEVLEKVDTSLHEAFEAWGGIDAALEKLCVVVTGDHSHAEIVDDAEQASVDLDAILAECNLANPGAGWTADDQVMICPNMRAAQIYFQRPSADRIQQVIDELVAEPRVDQVLWSESAQDTSSIAYHVRTADRGTLRFEVSRDGSAGADEYGGRWAWSGQLDAVDGRIDTAGQLVFDDYPNAFERIAGGLRHARAGHLWVTARPGCEFLVPGGSVHVAGASHGALHALDSVVPLLVSGAPDAIDWKAPPRTVDIAAVCLSLLGLESWRQIGDSHARGWDAAART